MTALTINYPDGSTETLRPFERNGHILTILDNKGDEMKILLGMDLGERIIKKRGAVVVIE